MIEKKYELSHDPKDELEVWDQDRQMNVTLKRIVALKDVVENKGKRMLIAKKGSKGGYIESESNLSQEGACWVANDAKVYGNANVSGDARVTFDAEVFGDAKISGTALVAGKPKVYDKASVYGNAAVYSNSVVFGEAKIYKNAKVYGKSKVYGKAAIHHDELIGDGVIER